MSFPQDSKLSPQLAQLHCTGAHSLHSPGHRPVAELPVARETVAKHGGAGRAAAVCGAGERTSGRELQPGTGAPVWPHRQMGTAAGGNQGSQ